MTMKETKTKMNNTNKTVDNEIDNRRKKMTTMKSNQRNNKVTKLKTMMHMSKRKKTNHIDSMNNINDTVAKGAETHYWSTTRCFMQTKRRFTIQSQNFDSAK